MIVNGTDASPTHVTLWRPVRVGGGGAFSWTARTAQLFLGVSAYSWNVQTVWSSPGSTTVNE